MTARLARRMQERGLGDEAGCQGEALHPVAEKEGGECSVGCRKTVHYVRFERLSVENLLFCLGEEAKWGTYRLQVGSRLP
jgi:hypothetical protein